MCLEDASREDASREDASGDEPCRRRTPAVFVGAGAGALSKGGRLVSANGRAWRIDRRGT